MSRSEKGRPRMATGSSTDGHRVVHGWPQGRPRMATGSSTDGHRVVHGWPQGRPRMATGSSTGGHRVVHGSPEVREAAMYHGTSKWQRGPPPSGRLQMAHRSSADGPTSARTGGESSGAHWDQRAQDVSHREARRPRCVCSSSQLCASPRRWCSVPQVLFVVRSPWAFHSCRSWTRLLTCPLLCNERCPWSCLCRSPWKSHSCRSWTRLVTFPLFSTTGAHGPDCAEICGDSTGAFLGQGC